MTPGLDHFLQRSGGDADADARAPWQALGTRTNCERLVGQQLRLRGFQVFDPRVPSWSWRGGVRRPSARPLFPGHLFLRRERDRAGALPLLGARGVLGVVPEREIESIRRVLDALLTPVPHPYVPDGRRVRIRRGPLADVEGFLQDTLAGRALLVLSIHLFRHSVAIEIDRELAALA
jgi:hypothetical protein